MAQDNWKSNYITVGIVGAEKYCLIEYSDGRWGVLIQKKTVIEVIKKKFINKELAHDCAITSMKYKERLVALSEESIEQLSLF